MSGKLIYHWKHGWIPLDHIAALSKAHGSEKGAARYLGKSASPSARRKPGAAFQGQGFLPGLPGQGELFGDSTGKSTHLGESAQNTARETPGSAHFRMSGTQLKELAGKGDKAAQAELDRRAARKNAAGGKAGGHREGVPFRPPASEPKATPSGNGWSEATRKAVEEGRMSTRQADRWTALEQQRRRNAPEAPKPAPEAPKPPKPLTPLTPAEKAANAATMYGVGSEQHLKALEAENRQIEKTLPGDRYTVVSKNMGAGGAGLGAYPDGTPRLLDTVHYNNLDTATLDRVGSVAHRPNGAFEARLNGTNIGTFGSRAGAHQALARAHQAALEKQAEQAKRAEQERARQAKAAEAAAKATPGPLNFRPAAPSTLDDGTYSGGKAAAKAKQVFTAGNKTVIIQSVMSKENTAALLRDISQVVDKAGTHHIPMTFMVPTGDPTFRSRRGHVVGGYVHSVVGRTVHINPKVANEHADAMGFGMGRSGSHFMPANSGVSARQWVITHEMGHVVDNVNNDTRTGAHLTPSGFDVGHMPAEGANSLAHQHRGNLSKYGNASAQEAYAEAFAQYVHGGPGSNAAADAFAERFGWPTPKTTTP